MQCAKIIAVIVKDYVQRLANDETAFVESMIKLIE